MEPVKTKDYELYPGDCIKVMTESIKKESMDLSVFSPPFASLYAYSSSDADMGNSRESDDEFLLHYEFSIPPLFAVMKPGTNTCVHVSDVPRLKEHHGYVGCYDLMGDVIRLMEKHGFLFYRRWTINKNPQAQSIRNHSVTLTFSQFEKDSRKSSAALADYLLVFQKPGNNPVPVCPEATRDEWIEWANPTWYGAHEHIRGISETDTLNTYAARNDQDERHICPLQLPLIDRVIRLYSNKGERVFTPFMGIGSEVYQAVKRNRIGIGVELKPEWFEVSVKTAERAVYERDAQGELFK